MLYKLLTATLPLVAATAYSMNLGVQGSTWEISEPDFRQRLMADAEKVDWKGINEGIAEDAKTLIDRQPQWDVSPATLDTIKLVDLTQRLTDDIKGFDIGPDGKLQEKTIFRKGYVFNPLQHFRPTRWFLVVSGESDEQVAWLSEMDRAMPGRFVFMAVDGKLSKIIERAGVPVAPTTPWIFATAGVTNTPALVGVSARNPTLLTVAQFQAPYTVQRAQEAMQ